MTGEDSAMNKLSASKKPSVSGSVGFDHSSRWSGLPFLCQSLSLCICLCLWAGSLGAGAALAAEADSANATDAGLGEKARVTVPLWPGMAPGDTDESTTGPERDTTRPSDNLIAGQRLIRLGHVTQPTLTVYPAGKPNESRPAVLVCPGGAYHILAWDLEGTEVCEWLNSIGVTGVLLKYRVGRRPDRAPHEAPLQDAQRAMGLIRQNAKEWGIDPDKIGVLGFSAGGHLAAVLSTGPAERIHPPIDAADELPFRPNFTLLIYPGYLTTGDQRDQISSELKITSESAPTFLVMAQDDGVGVGNVLHYSIALQKARVPFELHVYPVGGHGYGLRPTDVPVTRWSDAAGIWIKAQ